MDADAALDRTTSPNDFDSLFPEVGSVKADLLEGSSLNGEVMGELGYARGVVTKVELDIACASEKLINLNVLMMHVATRETELETFVSEEETVPFSSYVKAIECDLLSGIFDSEVREMDNFLVALQEDTVNARETISSCEYLGEFFFEIDEKLRDCQKSWNQSQEQLSEMKMQSAKFKGALPYFSREGRGGGSGGPESGQLSDMNANINMQTAEQQRHILRMLEKSLARELDLDKKLTESRQVEEDLKLRLHSSEHGVFCLEEEAKDVLERLFEADNAAEVLMGTSKELLARLRIIQFNSSDSIQREDDLRSKLESSSQESKAKELTLQKLEICTAELNDLLVAQTNSLKASLKEAEDKLILANSDAVTLREKVSSLEKQLKAFELQQHAVASAETCQEKQNTSYSTIEDMNDTIEDLKEKVLKAEGRVDSAEEKCVILSESNAELSEELRFMRERIECLEASLRQSEERKVEAAKEIGIRTKVITNLVVKLALERERLHKQLEKAQNVSAGEAQIGAADSTSEYETVRRVDAGVLSFKHLFAAALIFVASVAVYLFQQQNSSS